MRQHYPQKPPLGTPINWAHPLTKGLVGFWLFNESGGDLANDLSGNGNHGTINNMAFPPTATSGWNAGRRGVGLKFDGSNDYVDCGNDSSLNITDAITIEAWVKFPTGYDFSASNHWIVKKSNSVLYGFGFNIYSTRMRLQGGNGASNFLSLLTSSLSWSTEIWYNVAVTWDGNTINFYRNGINVGTATEKTGTISNNADYLAIGRYSNQSSEYFNGQIDQVRIYNRALSAQEIKQLYLYPYAGFPQPCNAWLYAAAAGGLSIPVAMHNYRRLRI